MCSRFIPKVDLVLNITIYLICESSLYTPRTKEIFPYVRNASYQVWLLWMNRADAAGYILVIHILILETVLQKSMVWTEPHGFSSLFNKLLSKDIHRVNWARHITIYLICERSLYTPITKEIFPYVFKMRHTKYDCYEYTIKYAMP